MRSGCLVHNWLQMTVHLQLTQTHNFVPVLAQEEQMEDEEDLTCWRKLLKKSRC